jgi:hypothetical protein
MSKKQTMRKILIPKVSGSIKKSEIRAAIKYAKAERATKESTMKTAKNAKNAFHLRPAS